jgi:hypothetical protein
VPAATSDFVSPHSSFGVVSTPNFVARNNTGPRSSAASSENADNRHYVILIFGTPALDWYACP